MSDYINIKDDRLWDVLFDEACVEGKQAERIQKELERIALDEKEIIRKPMERIVKKVTEKMKMHKRIRDEYEDLLGETTKTVQDKAVEVCEKILKIVKEEGGIE